MKKALIKNSYHNKMNCYVSVKTKAKLNDCLAKIS